MVFSSNTSIREDHLEAAMMNGSKRLGQFLRPTHCGQGGAHEEGGEGRHGFDQQRTKEAGEAPPQGLHVLAVDLG